MASDTFWEKGKVFSASLKFHHVASCLFSLLSRQVRPSALLGLQQYSPAARRAHHPITWSVVSLFTLHRLHLPPTPLSFISSLSAYLPLHAPQSHPVPSHLSIPLVSVNNMLHFNYAFRKMISIPTTHFSQYFTANLEEWE